MPRLHPKLTNQTFWARGLGISIVESSFGYVMTFQSWEALIWDCSWNSNFGLNKRIVFNIHYFVLAFIILLFQSEPVIWRQTKKVHNKMCSKSDSKFVREPWSLPGTILTWPHCEGRGDSFHPIYSLSH